MGAAIPSVKARALVGTQPAIQSAKTADAITSAGILHHMGLRITAPAVRRCHPPESN
jgi:hypothetical protein